jgi:dihydroorotase
LSFDLVIKNGFVVSHKEIFNADIGIEGEKIVYLGKPMTIKGEHEINADRKYVLPGCIDAHVHFREPLNRLKETWETGSEGAAFGGVTTVFDMPESMRHTKDEFIKKKAIADKGSLVDFSLYGGTTNPDIIKDLFDLGAIGFKILLGYEQFYLDNGQLFETFERIGRTGLPATVHAEDIHIIKAIERKLVSRGSKDILAHLKSRPSFVEKEAITRSVILSNAVNCRLHISHVSSMEGVEAIRNAKNSGVKITSETCPHYLLIKKKHFESLGPYGKINPPIRGSKRDIDSLWGGLNNGIIDCIATDHAPHTISEKESGWKNIFNASPGVIGVETMLPLMLTQVNNGKLSIMKLVELTSFNPSKTFNIYPKKGVIQIGSDADLVVIDINREKVIKSEEQHSKMPFTPFDGWKIKGYPETTIIRGKIVMKDNDLKVKPGYGAFIKPYSS